MQIEIFFGIIALVFSVVLHEVSHGYMANFLGDPTARLQGRLTLNPLKHLDPFGSIFLPAILILTHSPFLFGWAKPVPYNPYNLKRGGVWAEALVAGAGPMANFGIALGLALILRAIGGVIPEEVVGLAFSIIVINVALAVFNLIPIPPLDGSKILSAVLPQAFAMQWEKLRMWLEYNPLLGFGAVILFVMLIGGGIGPMVQWVARALVGV
ncbi:site-2 protease family protein [Candidatus Kaiserbacteria bacterium]|nr:site-2 protease family protein [Candidatus Kaiserbacteria bacterium]